MLIRAISQRPPCNDMGVLCTEFPVSSGAARRTEKPLSGFDNTISIDWLAFTLPCDDWQEAAKLLGLSGLPWIERDRGAMGYTEQREYQGIRILSSGYTYDAQGGKISMGVHCICSGSTLVHVPRSLPGVFSAVADQGGHFTRIDIALDDYQGLLSRSTIRDYYENYHFTTRAKEFQIIEGKRLEAGVLVDQGFTFYVGQRNGGGKRRNASESLLRIYQKDVEQQTEYHWWRVELQLRGDRARDFGLLLTSQTQSYEKYCVDLIRSFFTFRTPNQSDTNKRRWKIAGFWDALLSGAEILCLGWSKHRRRNISDKMRWMSRQVVKTIAQVATYFGPEILAGMAAEGIARMTQKDCEAIGFTPLPKFQTDLWSASI